MGETIKDFNENMTIFYGEYTGNIYEAVGGIQTVKDFYGESYKDFNYKALVIPRDNYVLDNIYKFKIVDDKLKVKVDDHLSKYI